MKLGQFTPLTWNELQYMFRRCTQGEQDGNAAHERDAGITVEGAHTPEKCRAEDRTGLWCAAPPDKVFRRRPSVGGSWVDRKRDVLFNWRRL